MRGGALKSRTRGYFQEDFPAGHAMSRSPGQFLRRKYQSPRRMCALTGARWGHEPPPPPSPRAILPAPDLVHGRRLAVHRVEMYCRLVGHAALERAVSSAVDCRPDSRVRGFGDNALADPRRGLSRNEAVGGSLLCGGKSPDIAPGRAVLLAWAHAYPKIGRGHGPGRSAGAR